MSPTHAQGAAQGRSLLSPEYRWVTIAALALVTIGAYENRAVTTILPIVATELDGLRWFGLATALPAATFLFASALAGAWTDHIGPRRILIGSLFAFALAQIGCGLAPTMEVLVAARALSGVGEGLLDISLVVLIADLLPESLRAKVFAAFSTAWILPSMLGPAIAGAITDWVGWRAAFLLPLLLLGLAIPALLPAIRLAQGREQRPWTTQEWATIRAAAIVAGAIAVLTWGVSAGASGSWLPIGAAVGAAIVVAARLTHVLPTGTLRAERGAPALILTVLTLSVAFTGIGSLLPLLLATVRGQSAAIAGLSLSITGVFWALGSNISSRDALRRRYSPGRISALAMALMAVGGLGPLLLALDLIPLAPALVAFALSATGMGLINTTLSVHLTVLVPGEELGKYLAARTIAVAVGVAAATATGGALVAAEADHLTAQPITLTVVVGILAALATVPLARRVDAGHPQGTAASSS